MMVKLYLYLSLRPLWNRQLTSAALYQNNVVGLDGSIWAVSRL